MKEYSAKSLEDALDLASKDLGIAPELINYEVTSEKLGLFKKIKSITIAVFDMFDVVTYIEDYLARLFGVLGINARVKPKLEDDIIAVDINSEEHNSLLIGRQGNTLEALTTLVRQSTSQHFKKMILIRLDVSGYKAKRYSHLTHLAKIWAKNVLRSKQELVLDPLPPDERRIIHQTLGTYKNLSTKSVGEGRYKRLAITYTGPQGERTPRPEPDYVETSEETNFDEE